MIATMIMTAPHLSDESVAANSLHDSAVVEANWPIIANTEVLNVSQQYAGHPGYLVSECSNALCHHALA